MIPRSLPFAFLTATLAAAALPTLAQTAPSTAPDAATQPNPATAPNATTQPNGEDRPRGEGGRGEGGRGEGGRREGGPRGGGEGAQRPDETTEQFQARLLAPYVEQIPDLSDAQKTHILAIIDAANAESRAARANTTLSEARQRAVTRAIRADIPNRVRSALTEAQLGPYQAQLDEQAENAAAMSQVVTARPAEDMQQMRERVTKGYESVLEELSIKQKTQLIQILQDAGELSAAVQADATTSAAQKSAALLKIHDSVNAKVLPLLDSDQKKTWKTAHDAKKLTLS